MEFRHIEDRDQIEAYLQTRPELHIYALGDLDDEFWPHTHWHAALDNGKIEAIGLVFLKYDTPIVHLISEPENRAMPGLAAAVADRLPDYAEIHLGPAAEGALDDDFEFLRMRDHVKMALHNRAMLEAAADSPAQRLGTKDIEALRELYEAVYRDVEKTNVFYPSMLDAGPYFGIRENGRLVSAAGVHVFSPRHGVAAVANVATHPERRGNGLASAVTAALCRELALQATHIGLNVEQSNEPALRAYQRLGFEVVSNYREGFIRRR